MKNLYVYDLETYKNCFTACIADVDNRKIYTFEISFRKDERKKLFKYLSHIYKTGGKMVGYNNIAFDYPVLHFLTQNKDASANRIYQKAQSIIDAGFGDERFRHMIPEYKWFIPQIDLLKVHHFDNKARMTSLKMLEFNMRSKNIEDLPFPVGIDLTSDQIDTLLIYNKHDVRETVKFLEKSYTQLEFREELSKKYKKNFMNHNDTKIGKDYFIMELEKEMPKCCYDGGKVQQTPRSEINLGECILPYIKFERPEFKALKEWFEQQTIRETKGVFTDLREDQLGDVAQYANMKVKRQKLAGKPSEKTIEKWKAKKPACWFSEEELKSGKKTHWVNWHVAESLNVVVNGYEYVLGVGGLHMSVSDTVLLADDKNKLIDADVASYYPNLAIKNRIYPEHLSEKFCDIYEDVYNQRKALKKAGKNTEQQMMKLALNGVYGDSNNRYSPFYDAKYTMTITIGGQMSLLMLVEKLLEADITVIQCNTDGLTSIVPNEKEEEYFEICKWWEELTKLELEYAHYSRMFVGDVNNYIAEYEGGESVKCKGRFVYDDLGWHQNQSGLVIKKAAYEYIINEKPIDETIKECKNPFDFCLRTKVPRSSSLVLVDEFLVDHPLQNICRYHVAKEDGEGVGELVKVMPPVQPTRICRIYEDQHGERYKAYSKTDVTKYEKIPKTDRGRRYTFIEEIEEKCEDRRIGIDTGWKVKPCNDMDDFDINNINYDYYITEAEKLAQFVIDYSNNS